jgi:hypothetical protein
MSEVGHLQLPPERLLWAIFLAAACLFAARARADEPPAHGAVTEAQQEDHHGKKRTVLHFGEDDIHGDLTRPDGELVQAPRHPSQPTLLRVRRNFLDRALSGVQRGQ